MSKIDIDKFICNLFAQGALPKGSKERAYVENALQDCGLEYYAGEIVERKKEPKFKVGDFIANDYCFGKVIKLTDDAYLLDTGQGIPFSCEHNVHLWSIEDAQDGDVLAADVIESHPSPFVAICKKQDGKFFETYCFIGHDGKFYKGETGHAGEYVQPATKEQRELLFSKMKDAGYEWDAEKKELNEIETHQWENGDVVRKKSDGTEWMITLDKEADYPCNWFICRINYEGLSGGWVSDIDLDDGYEFVNNPLKDALEAVDKEFQKIRDSLKKEMATKK